MASATVQPCPCQTAKNRLAAIERAQANWPFAQAAYDQAKGAPVPEITDKYNCKIYENITNNPAELKKYGLKTSDLTIPGTGFQAAVFESGNQLIVSFKGTDPNNSSDRMADVEQAVGLQSQYYSQAQIIAQQIQKNLPDGAPSPEFVGHSLGGGLASAAAAVTGYPATTYNAAGLNARNIPPANSAECLPPEDVLAVKVRGDIVTSSINKVPFLPDTYQSDELMLDPPPNFGRDTVVPARGAIIGGLIARLEGVAPLALLKRGIMLHGEETITESLNYDEKRANNAVAVNCK